jgi:tRNA1(Val) A37 N6-methylase TrmN6
MPKKNKQPYPAGWNEERIRKLAEHYDNQTEDEQVAEHEAALRAEGQTVMVVPTELVPEIVKLINKKRPA